MYELSLFCASRSHRLVAAIVGLGLCAVMSGPAAADTTTVGVASFYGGSFHGRPTASGERFNMHAMTAAHRTYPLGTRVKVTNLRNGKSVTLRINDRGPFIKGRVIDVSQGAAAALGFIPAGLTTVRIERVDAVASTER